MKVISSNQQDHTQLWIQFQNGDEQAFGKIYEAYIQTIYGYAKKITKDEEFIEDTIHNFFIYLWQHRKNLAIPKSIKFYLFSSVKREIYKELSRRREACSASLLTTEPRIQTTDTTAEENLIEHQQEKEIQLHLQNAFGLLSSNQRQAIELKYYGNLSCQEISGVMGLNSDNVYKLISRGLAIMKKNFRKDAFYKV